MCTLTCIPIKDGICVTCNRDESPLRETELPEWYEEAGHRLLFARDKEKKGTWFTVSNDGRIACLLNGAYQNHERKDSYRLSRGRVLLDVFLYDNPGEFIANYNFKDIEPFTLVVIHDDNILEIIWDGNDAILSKAKANKKHIWCSVPLYNKEMREKRYEAFHSLQFSENTPETALEFNISEDPIYDNEGIKIDRGIVRTVSTTQVILTKDKIQYKYLLHDNEKDSPEIITKTEQINS